MYLTKKLNAGKLILELIMIVTIMFYLIPLWMIITNSLKTPAQANKLNLDIPLSLQFENYIKVIRDSDAVMGLLNGIYLGVSVVVLVVFFSSMASYYLARLNNRFSRFSYNYFVLGLIIPGAIIPTIFNS